jgi:hypothetical protein
MFDEGLHATDTGTESRARERFAAYESTVSAAEDYHRRGRHDAAAAFAHVAALMALRPHAGLFASPRLERMLLDIGRRTAVPTIWRRPATSKIKSVLHVATEMLPVGGLVNNLVHWLRADAGRTHSLALTGQHIALPEKVSSEIIRSGGQIHRINQTIGHQVAWARKLRDIAQGHDVIVLHTYGQDPIPVMAFAEADKRPPVLLLNHADHLFWLGASVADVVLNMRQAAQDLTIMRRGVAPERNIVLPTVVSTPVRRRTRVDARRELGIAEDAILLLSAARELKYNTVDGVTFAATHVELLKKHPKAELLVVGAGERPDWAADKAAVNGRIRSLPPTPDTSAYFEACDIYVDSFPFVSSTSMMEAAGLGAPLVSRFYGPDDARIFAINHPGIDKPTLHACTETAYLAYLDRLISDPDFRMTKGQEARQSVLAHHTMPGWAGFLEKAYQFVEAITPVQPASVFPHDQTDTFSHGEPDRSLYNVFGFGGEASARLLRGIAGLLPVAERSAVWTRLLRERGFWDRKDAVRLLFPTWLLRRLQPR